MRQIIGAFVIGICAVPALASAQDRPFVFSVTMPLLMWNVNMSPVDGYFL